MIFHILSSIDILCQFVSRPKLKFELTFCIFIFIFIFYIYKQIICKLHVLTHSVLASFYLCFAFACENFWLLYFKQLWRILWKFFCLHCVKSDFVGFLLWGFRLLLCAHLTRLHQNFTEQICHHQNFTTFSPRGQESHRIQESLACLIGILQRISSVDSARQRQYLKVDYLRSGTLEDDSGKIPGSLSSWPESEEEVVTNNRKYVPTVLDPSTQ